MCAGWSSFFAERSLQLRPKRLQLDSKIYLFAGRSLQLRPKRLQLDSKIYLGNTQTKVWSPIS